MNAVPMESTATLHYFDREFATPAVKLLPGEYFVTSKDMLLTTVLGSCVAACVRDSVTGVGGMNHFMLPEETLHNPQSATVAMRYGAYAMAMLMQELFKAGARREHLEAKVFGGGAVMSSMTTINIGDHNADFVLRYLQAEQIRVVAQDLRGNLPRRINYFPATGRVTMRKLRRQEDSLLVRNEEQALAQALSRQPIDKKLLLLDSPVAVNRRTWTP